MPEARAPGLRQRKAAETRRRIQEVALRLFLDQGFETTTVEQIANAAGVSQMTLFRHFGTKEGVVENDDYDPYIAQLIRDRPAGEGRVLALRRALLQGIGTVLGTQREALLVRTRLLLTTPALRAHLADNQYATERLFTQAMLDREGSPADEFKLRVHAAATLGALNVALSAWVASDGEDVLEELVRVAFAELAGSGYEAAR